MYRSIFWKYMYNIPGYTVNNWNHHQTIVNTNTSIVTLYFIHSTRSVLEILFKSISNHHWSLRKMKVNRPVYDMESQQFPRWDDHVQILCLILHTRLALFYEDLLFNHSKLWKRLIKLDPSLEVRNFEISFTFSLSLFYCGFQYRPLPSIQLTGFHFCYQHQLFLIPLDPGLMRSL